MNVKTNMQIKYQYDLYIVYTLNGFTSCHSVAVPHINSITVDHIKVGTSKRVAFFSNRIENEYFRLDEKKYPLINMNYGM